MTNSIHQGATPKSLGYFFPAEFAKQDATWLSWPHKEASWPGKLDSIYPSYIEFIKVVTKSQRVCINVVDASMQAAATKMMQALQVDFSKVIHSNKFVWNSFSFILNKHIKYIRVITRNVVTTDENVFWVWF